MTNREFAAKTASFAASCEAAGVYATKRQASKYRAGRGAAYKNAVEGFTVTTNLAVTK